MKIDVFKILAAGCTKRFMYILINGHEYCVRISDALYELLYSLGVPTSQKIRWQRHK